VVSVVVVVSDVDESLGGLAKAGEAMEGVAISTSISAAVIAIVAVSAFPFVDIINPQGL
jgi:Na+/H+ antiporter NhaC